MTLNNLSGVLMSFDIIILGQRQPNPAYHARVLRSVTSDTGHRG